jgi:hypothetical protein
MSRNNDLRPAFSKALRKPLATSRDEHDLIGDGKE